MILRTVCGATAALALVACTDATPTAVVPNASKAKAAPPTDAAVSVVMSGLDSPRGLAFGPEGALYVAEAGSSQINGPCIAARGQTCYSGTGAISRLWKGQQARVVSDLPSWYNPVQRDIGGPNDIGFQGRGNGWFTIGWGTEPARRSEFGERAYGFGTLSRFTPNGAWSVEADVSAFETANNPAGGPVDSNPFGLLVEPQGKYIADAGANALLAVDVHGDVSLVAVFAPVPVPPGPFNPPFAQSDPVPTEVQRGPDGALYVSTLTGVPFRPGAASIYRVLPGQAPQVYAGGFTTITDFDFAPDGTMYVVQYASAPFFGGQGSVIRVAPDNGARTTVIANLQFPTGIVVGPDGALYVSNRGSLSDVGEVLRIVP